MHVYAGAYLAAVAERGGTLDTWEVHNRRRAPPEPLHRATARMMLQLAPDARKTASELMASEFVGQSLRGRKRKWVKVCPQTTVPRDGGASCVPPHAAAATTTDAPRASASSRRQARCTCSGVSDNKHSQHLCTRQGRRQCKNMLENGQDSAVCSQCRCRLCGKGRWKSGHCYAHALHETGEVLPLVHKFTDVLGHWLPMDLHALMQSGVRDPAGFYMQAMLWEPWAVEAFGRDWEATGSVRDSRYQRLRRAGAAALTASARVRVEEPERFEVAMQTLTQSGVCRWFGCASFGRACGLMRLSSGHSKKSRMAAESLVLGQKGHSWVWCTEVSSPIMELCRVMPAEAAMPVGMRAPETLQTFVATYGKMLSRLGAWANYGPGSMYIQPHVLRKAMAYATRAHDYLEGLTGAASASRLCWTGCRTGRATSEPCPNIRRRGHF